MGAQEAGSSCCPEYWPSNLLSCPNLLAMGSGASTEKKGYTGKAPIVAEFKDGLEDWLGQEAVKGILGDKFSEAEFDTLANSEKKIHKVAVLIKAHLIQVASDYDGLLA